MEKILNEGLELITTFIEGLIVVHFVLAFQDFDFKVRFNKLKFLCTSLLYTALVLLINYLLPFEGLLGVIYILFFIFVSLPLTDSKIHIRVLSSTIAVVILIFASTLISNLFSTMFRVPLEQFYSELSLIRFFALITSLIIKLFVFDIILKAMQQNDLKLGKREWGLILSVFCIAFVIIALVQTVAANIGSSLYVILLFVAELLSGAIVVVCFYMTIALNKAQRSSEELRTLARQNEYRQQYAQNIKKQYNEIRRIYHDMKQSNSVVIALLSEVKTDEAIKYMKKTVRDISEFDIVIDVGNDFVNAILNTKISEAKHLKIGILCSVDKEIASVDEVDLCNLLGNMIDNAIEACDKQISGERFIEVKIQAFPHQFLIGVANTVDRNVMDENSELLTTKDDAENHGFGIQSIRAIVKKYDGTVQFSQDNGFFHCDVVLTR